VTDPVLHVLGVRHHGPGSARSVAAALEELRPDLVLIEGAPELDALTPLAGHADLVPPVAGLVYAVDAPRRAAFYPLAVFSPEWVALRWAVSHGVEVRFADLPASVALAQPAEGQPTAEPLDGEGGEGASGRPAAPYRPDAVAELARAAGYDDPERWWEDAVEHRRDSTLDRFAALAEAMTTVREQAGRDPENDRREAAMRRAVRGGETAGRERIAFVCGAYHAPALDRASFPTQVADNRLLAKLPTTKVAATWAPWTAGRLASASGYGAGVRSPGWYHHLYVTPDEEVVPGWMVRVARALRDEQLDASPASVVEATRLAEALAAVRGRPSVGLTELEDATRSVLTEGSDLPLALIDRKLVIGELLGTVPRETPMVPLAADLTRLQKSCRLRPSASVTTVQLDLRKDAGRARSVLLHRLRLLDIGWGQQVDAGRSTGTFKEAWQLEWQPELAVAVIEASLHGTTVASAAEGAVLERAPGAPDLATLGTLIEGCLVAELPGGLAGVVRVLAERTALQHDTLALLEAVEPLARTCRYGDVRGADVGDVTTVLETVTVRAALGLRAACQSLDDDAAERMRRAIEGAQRGVTLLDRPALTEPWQRAVVQLAGDQQLHGSISGRVNRLLLDAGVIDSDEAIRRLSRRLSSGAAAPAGAAWLDGFLAGEALLLLHDDALLGVIDSWVAEIGETTFEDLLPLLRRTFSRYEPAERRQIGAHLRDLGRERPPIESTEFDLGQALPAVDLVARLLGLEVTR
jgi:hypothetical protein